MPFMKKSKRSFRHSKKGPSNKTLNKKIKKIESQIELKLVDTYQNGTVNAGGVLTLLNGLTPGVEGTDQPNGGLIGNECHFTSLQLRGTIIGDKDYVDGPVVVRAIVFWDRQANGAAPVLAAASPAPALLDVQIVTSPTEAPFMYQTQDRFRVLYDKRFVINPKFGTVTNPPTSVFPEGILFKKKIKLGRKTKFDIPDGAITGIVTNSLYYALVSDAAANEPLVQTGLRVYYKDA